MVGLRTLKKHGFNNYLFVVYHCNLEIRIHGIKLFGRVRKCRSFYA